MKNIVSLLLVIVCIFSYATGSEYYIHNTYKDTIITPQTLLTLLPKMPAELEKQVNEWLLKYHDFITQLVTTPHPLTYEKCRKKIEDNYVLIKEYEDRDEVKNLSNFNYVLRFSDFPHFIIFINSWRSRIAYWLYSSDQGNVLNPSFNVYTTDCSQFEYMPSYQHCSRAAYYLRVTEAIEKGNFQYLKTVPTYLVHIDGKPEELSDENYILIHAWIDDIIVAKDLSEEKVKKIWGTISYDALKEIHEAIIYAALWDQHTNLAFKDTCLYGSDNILMHYYILDLEEPFNHKENYFYFRGEEGIKKYMRDVIVGLERMALKFVKLDLLHQFEDWKQLTENHVGFKQYCQRFSLRLNFDLLL